MELRVAIMPGCVLLPYDTAAGVCAACGESLVRRQKRWCSKECEQVYHRNHYWSFARKAAVKRDKACVKCGWADEYWDSLRSGQFVMWSRANLLGYHPANWLEVNHIMPRVGAGYGTGCWNHLSNLETLCHPCHVKVTNRQRIGRARAKAS
jgi:5-methylcytosine-specific restriction endonuclease McrA